VSVNTERCDIAMLSTSVPFGLFLTPFFVLKLRPINAGGVALPLNRKLGARYKRAIADGWQKVHAIGFFVHDGALYIVALYSRVK